MRIISQLTQRNIYDWQTYDKKENYRSEIVAALDWILDLLMTVYKACANSPEMFCNKLC